MCLAHRRQALSAVHGARRQSLVELHEVRHVARRAWPRMPGRGAVLVPPLPARAPSLRDAVVTGHPALALAPPHDGQASAAAVARREVGIIHCWRARRRPHTGASAATRW